MLVNDYLNQLNLSIFIISEMKFLIKLNSNYKWSLIKNKNLNKYIITLKIKNYDKFIKERFITLSPILNMIFSKKAS
jgi:hypothetical protein